MDQDLSQLQLRVEEPGQSSAHPTDETSLYREKSAVWFTGQQPRAQQRNTRLYDEESFVHPGKMLPHVVRSIIETYGEPGDLWFDPMCGIGTTLVEAMQVGYNALGIEFEPRWVEVTARNIRRTRDAGAPGSGRIIQGDARAAAAYLGDERVTKIAFSPPYGNTLSKTSHGPDKNPDRQSGGKRAARALRHGYSFTGVEHAAIPDEAGDMAIADKSPEQVNLGDLKHGDLGSALATARALRTGSLLDELLNKPSYLSEMAKVYDQCFRVLSTGGLMILVLRDYRRNKKRVDLLGDTLRICQELGFVYHDRTVALQCPVVDLDGRLQCTPEGHLGFWTIQNAKDKIPPLMVPVFEDVLILRKDRDRKK